MQPSLRKYLITMQQDLGLRCKFDSVSPSLRVIIWSKSDFLNSMFRWFCHNEMPRQHWCRGICKVLLWFSSTQLRMSNDFSETLYRCQLRSRVRLLSICVFLRHKCIGHYHITQYCDPRELGVLSISFGYFMMVSWYKIIFLTTGPLQGESTDAWWMSPT